MRRTCSGVMGGLLAGGRGGVVGRVVLAMVASATVECGVEELRMCRREPAVEGGFGSQPSECACRLSIE